MPVQSPIKVAILDDYASTSTQYFTPICTLNKIGLKIFTEPLSHLLSRSSDQHPTTDDLTTLLLPYTIICTMRERTPFPGSLLTTLPNLKLILTTGTRNASIDLQTCRERGIVVAGTVPRQGSGGGGGDFVDPRIHSDTNEQTWALILGLAKNVAEDDRRLKFQRGGWQDGLVYGLAGRTLGVLGLGRLGLQCAVTGALGFGMNVVAWSENLSQGKAEEEVTEKRGLPTGLVTVVESKRELFRVADVVSVHYVLSERSRGMVGREELAVMKPDSLLVNTSRGPIVDEAALLETLREGRIRGAALDVFDTEPLPPDSPWRSQEWGKNGRSHVLLSPHTGYVEERTMHDWYEQNARNLQRWLDGEEVINVL